MQGKKTIDIANRAKPRAAAVACASILFILISLGSAGCAPRDATEVIGTYVFEDSREKDVYVLEENHTFRRVLFTKATNGSRVETGTWVYPTVDNIHVRLVTINPDDPSRKLRDTKALEKWLGVLYLGMDEDGGRQYKKID